MKIKKILIYLIFAFVMILPFNVHAENVEYDIKFNTSKIQMVDYNYLNKLKLNAYNLAITKSEYLSKHSVIESYNEFYINHAYFIAYASDGEISLYIDFDSDYIDGYIYYIDTYNNNSNVYDTLSEFKDKVGILYHYDLAFSFNNDGKAYIRNDNYNYYSWVDKNINNTDFVYDYDKSDLLTSNSILPNFYYPILGTNRSVKWQNVENLTSSSSSSYNEYENISSVLSIAYGANFEVSNSPVYGILRNFRLYNILLKTFNNNLLAGNIFRHPYSTEETEKITGNVTSRIISINSSNYSSLRINYNINSDLKKDWYWWTNPWSYGEDKEKQVADWLVINITATNSISFPRRYTGYKKGNEIELTKMPNDFDNKVLSTNFATRINSLDGRNGALNGYFDFDLRDLPENTIITIYLEYDPNYVEFEPVELPETNYIEYDISGKYAVGLVPKFTYSNNKFSLLYQGNFTSYYAFNSNNYNVYDSEILNSSDIYSKKLISFSNFADTELYEKPIFYLINNYYTDSSKISKIKYNPDYFELLVFNSLEDTIESEYSGYFYPSPPQDFTSNNSGINSENNSSNSAIDLSLTSLFSKLPDLIGGLSNAFIVLGQCITIAFASLPEIVQSVLYISLIITIILIAIKLIK